MCLPTMTQAGHKHATQCVIVKEIYGGTLSAPQYRPRLVSKMVPQDINFDIFDVNKKITLAKFGFLTNYVQPRNEKISIAGIGGGDT